MSIVKRIALAVCLIHEKQYPKAEGLLREVIQKAKESPDPGVLGDMRYNVACAAAIAGRKEAALEYLQNAAELGEASILTMATDDDLKSLRKGPRFTALIAKAKEHAAAVQKKQ